MQVQKYRKNIISETTKLIDKMNTKVFFGVPDVANLLLQLLKIQLLEEVEKDVSNGQDKT